MLVVAGLEEKVGLFAACEAVAEGVFLDLIVSLKPELACGFLSLVNGN